MHHKILQTRANHSVCNSNTGRYQPSLFLLLLCTKMLAECWNTFESINGIYEHGSNNQATIWTSFSCRDGKNCVLEYLDSHKSPYFNGTQPTFHLVFQLSNQLLHWTKEVEKPFLEIMDRQSRVFFLS